MAENQTILGGEDNSAILENTVVTPAAGDPATADTTTQTFDYTKMVNADGGLAENWREALPEDIRNERCLDSIKTVGTLAKSFVSAQKMIGANKIALPGENATPDEIDAFHRALGRPDKQEAYSVEGIELPDGIELDDQMVEGFREYAFKHGMSQKDFAEAIAFVMETISTCNATRAFKICVM